MEKDNREVLLDVKHLEVTFNNSRKNKGFRAVKNANFQIYKGETFGLVGESGSGKTTIGRSIMRLNPISDGEIWFEGKRIDGKISKIDYCVSEGLYNFHLYKDEADRERKVDEALEAVGLLPEHKSRYPHEFSGGQRQRVGIARAMIMEPKFIIADEPISALDVSIRAQVLNLMNKFKEERGLTYMFIAHDLSVVRYFADRIAVIHNGRIVEVAPTEELFKYPLHPYTLSLLQAVPMPDPQIEKAKELVVYDESKRDLSGEKPILREIRPGHFVFANERELGEYQQKLKEMHAE